MEKDLEKRLEEYHPLSSEQTSLNPKTEKKSLYEKVKDLAANYIVDVSSGWTFFTPIYGAMESFVVGMDSEKVLKSRLAGLVGHAIAMRPTGLLRNALAKKWNVTKESPFYKKWAVNACAQTPIQAVIYTGMLIYSGASLDEIKVALPIGLAIAFPLFEPFGWWMDTWRKFWGKKPAIK